MTRSPHRSPSDKAEASDESQTNPNEPTPMAKFEDLAKKLLGISKEDLKRELEREKAGKLKLGLGGKKIRQRATIPS